MTNLAILPEHFEEFKSLILKSLLDPYSTVKRWGKREVIDLLPFLRKTQGDYEDSAINLIGETNPVWEYTVPGLSLVKLNKDTGQKVYLSDGEPDEIILSIDYFHPYFNKKDNLINPNKDEDLRKLFTLLQIYMLSDCTGCCDAIKFIRSSIGGIYSRADVSMTYHS